MGTDDRDRQDLDDLEHRLDAAFATTRPRRGFEDELWGRLRPRQPRPGLLERLRSATVPLASTGVALVLLAGLVTWLVNHQGAGGGAGGAGGAASTAAGPEFSAPSGLRFGAVPRPPLVAAAGGAPLAGSAAGRTEVPAPAPAVPATLPVYRYPAAAGPAPGTVLGVPPSTPAGAESAPYPTRAASLAIGEWQAKAGVGNGQPAGRQATITQVQLVYVAVTEGPYGYLVPAYKLTGSVSSDGSAAPVSVLLPAVATYALR